MTSMVNKFPLWRRLACSQRNVMASTSMTPRRLASAVALMMMSLVTLSAEREAWAQIQDGTKQAYVLSTATTGGAFHQGGVSLSALVKIKLLPDERIDLTTRNSSGSMQNIARLGDGTTDFAIVQGLLGYHARRGTGPARQLGRQGDLRAITMLWPNVEHFIIRKSAVTSGTIQDLANLRGKRVSFGREASAIESNRFLLANLGLDITRDFDQAFMSFSASASAFRRGEIDGLSFPASTPVSGFLDLLESLGPDATILNWTEDDLVKADGSLSLWSELAIPPRTYPLHDDVINTIAQPNFLAVRAGVDDDVVYAITKAIFENLPFLKRLHRPFQYLTTESALAGLPVPLHPGALRYFQEIRLDMGNTVVAKDAYQIFGNGTQNLDEIRRDARNGVVSVMVPEDGTSDQLVSELVDVVGREENLRVLPLKGMGAAHNLADLLYLSGVDVSVLQIDAMELARDQDVFPSLTNNIRYITKWLDQEVHILVQDNVLRLDHLAGKPVNFGPRGSGSEVTAARIFNKYRVPAEQKSFSHHIALQKLKDGEIAGMVYVAGKPIPLFDDIEVRDGLRLLSLPKIDVNSQHDAPATLTEDDYPTLVFGNRTIETFSVPSVLAAYNWPAESDRYQPIKTFIETLFDHLDELQTSPRHPKWQEIDPSFDLDQWQRHEVSEIYVQQLRTAETTIGQGGPLTPTSLLPDRQPATSPATRPDREALPSTPKTPSANFGSYRPVF